MTIAKIKVNDDAISAELEISELEAKTRALFKAHFKINDFTQDEAALRQVFESFWSSALTLSQIVPLFLAFRASTTAVEYDAQKALGRLVRAKVLRSYRKEGKRFWEVNL